MKHDKRRTTFYISNELLEWAKFTGFNISHHVNEMLRRASKKKPTPVDKGSVKSKRMNRE